MGYYLFDFEKYTCKSFVVGDEGFKGIANWQKNIVEGNIKDDNKILLKSMEFEMKGEKYG